MSIFDTAFYKHLADLLAADLAPLSTVHHNFAKFRVEAGTEEMLGTHLTVFAPEHCRIHVPKTFQTFPVQFVEWEPTLSDALDLDLEIDISGIRHLIYV